MAHMLEANDRMFSFGEKPWHYEETKDRTNVTDVRPTTISEAIEASGLGWMVEKTPLFTQQTVLDMSSGISYEYYPVDGVYATRRSDDQSVLGIVGERYNVLQNYDLFEFAEAILIASSNGEAAEWETAGSIQGGKKVWTLLKLPSDFAVKNNDVVGSYMMVTTSHDGSMAFSSCVTPIRVVCHNTLSMALKDNSGLFRTKHTLNLDTRMAEARIAMGMASRYMNEFREYAEALSDVRITKDEAKDYFTARFPDTPITQRLMSIREFTSGGGKINEEDTEFLLKHGTKKSEDRPQRLRSFAMDLWENGETCLVPGSEETAWSAFNAASEVYEHEYRMDTSTRRGRKPTPENQWEKVVFGEGLDWRKNALDDALAMIA